ncbi:MAG: hypothetical protein GWN00_29850, partial [Aliifodinibius sp.]|nr:hypothetical protein [Fodinibius sp.]NIV15005.1 hypothetical protein [Fodinibius sp.]NIY28842.1 hypothetical protein [Fodinibius sp.]
MAFLSDRISIQLNDIGGVDLSSSLAYQSLTFDGTNWVNAEEKEPVFEIDVGPTNAYPIDRLAGIYHINTSNCTDTATITIPDSIADNDGAKVAIIAEDVTHEIKIVTSSGQLI